MYKYKFILLNNVKNDFYDFSLSDSKNEHSIINKNNNFKLLILLLLMINLHILKFYPPSIPSYEDNIFQIDLNEQYRIMSNYSLYNIYKYDQISLLFYGITNLKINKTSLLNFIDSLKQQTLKDIQIIFILPNGLNDSEHNVEVIKIIKDNKMDIFIPSENQELNINYLMNFIKGKFTFIFNKFIIFPDNELEKLFLMTNGKIDNIFEFEIQNTSFYLKQKL